MTKPKAKRTKTYFLVLETAKKYTIKVDAESREDAANIGMKQPLEQWTDLRCNSTILQYVEIEPQGDAAVKYHRQKWGMSKGRWERRKLGR